MKAFPYKVILVTGGAGSFGSALTKYLLDTYEDVKVRIYSRDEHKHEALRAKLGEDRVSYLIGDVRDLDRLRLACSGVDLVVHAAAVKHVPACEYNPLEAAMTNINGTGNVVRACVDCHVKQAILLSTDKAVSPINNYGATKLCAEKLWVQGNVYASSRMGTRFTCTRYGNVMDSKGGVIEFWKNRLSKGMPIPITSAEMTRFWMTLQEAVALVVSAALEQSKGGIIVPNLPAFELKDLADVMCEKYGTKSTVIEHVGIRPGEKLHEELLTEYESVRAMWKSDYGATFFIPATIQNWEQDFPVNGSWNKPPCPYLYVDIDDKPGEKSLLCYNSRDWPWRLDKKQLGEVLKACV